VSENEDPEPLKIDGLGIVVKEGGIILIFS
jgi:hypothetical protein